MTYAIRTDDGWHELHGSFKATVEVNGVPDELSFPPNWIALASEEERAAIGIFEIAEPEPVTDGLRVIGDAIEGYAVEIEIEGDEGPETIEVERPRRVWITEAITLDDAKAAKRSQVKAKREAAFRAGWVHDFGDAGTHTLDLRHADDKTNWTLLLIKTSGMIAADLGAETVTIRTAANESIEISATDANAAMTAFLAWGEAVLAKKWALDEAIAAAEDGEALAAVDIEADWP